MALNPLVSLFGRLVARSGRKRGNRQTDTQYRQTDRHLAAHARRGLITGRPGHGYVRTCIAGHARNKVPTYIYTYSGPLIRASISV